MTQIGKLMDMFYQIHRNSIQLEVVKTSETHPDTHITQYINSRDSTFWQFILEAVVEAKEDEYETIRNEDGEYNSKDIEKATQKVEYLKNIENALEFMIPAKNIIGD